MIVEASAAVKNLRIVVSGTQTLGRLFPRMQITVPWFARHRLTPGIVAQVVVP
jgi:hypothetical protein